MSRISVPRWAMYAIVAALLASLSYSIGSFRSAHAESHDAPFHGCLFAGSLSQVSTNPPTNCGRGVPVSWPSAAAFDDLHAALEQEIEDRIAADHLLQNAILVLNTDVGSLRDDLTALQDRVFQLEGQVSTLESQMTNVLGFLTVLDSAIADLEVTVSILYDAVCFLTAGAVCP